MNADSPVILVSASNSVGVTYIRWYPNVWSAERNHVMMTVTADGISIHTRYLDEIPDSWLAKAKELREILLADPYADLSRVATHKHSVVSNGPLVEITHSNV